MLSASSHREACDIGRSIDGVGISQQSFHIMSKIREVDVVMRTRPPQCKVRECHPEMSYALWANGPLNHPKKRSAGRNERTALIDAAWPGARESVTQNLPRGRFAPDDLHDAFAALWTAQRIREGRAVVFPVEPDFDEHGLAMEIVA
jgi:predicted RNase H-like nuclease